MKRSTDEVLAELDALVYDWAAMVERLPGIRKTAACGCTDEARITLGQRENYRMSEFDSGVYMRSTTADERYPACIVLAIKDRWGPGPEAECKFDRHLPHLERDSELPIEEVEEKPPLLKITGMMISDGAGNYECVDCGRPGDPFELCICSREVEVKP